MRPIKVKITDFVDGRTVEGDWVDCDSRAAVVVVNYGVFYVAVESLEVLPCESVSDLADSLLDGGSKPPAGSGLETKPVVRRWRRKRVLSPRGPRSNQWKPTEFKAGEINEPDL